MKSCVQSQAWENVYQRRDSSKLQGAELAKDDFLTASSENSYDFNNQLHEISPKCL